MTKRLVITRGLPASGKTTRARAWVAEESCFQNRVRVNRDDLREQFFGGWTGHPVHENAVTTAAHAAVRALLRAGYDVVCDDTNLRASVVQVLQEIAEQTGAAFEVWDMTDVPVETCIARDAVRAARGDRHVGEEVIRLMHAELTASATGSGG